MATIHEACPNCQETRAAGNLATALDCRDCDGKGIRRVPASYVCNQCGGPMCPDVPYSPNSQVPHGLVEAKVMGGYDSPHLSDMGRYQFSLCEDCLRKMFNTFKIPPEVRHFSIGVWGDTGTEYSYADDRDSYEHGLWRDAKGPEEKLLTGICNYRKWCTKPAEWRHMLSGSLTSESFCTEHKRGAANSCFVPAAEVGPTIPLKAEERTRAQREQIAVAYLKVRIRAQTEMTSFRYLDRCLSELVGCDSNLTGGLFRPVTPPGGSPVVVSSSLMERVLNLRFYNLPLGVLYFGDQKKVARLARDGRNHGIVPVKVLEGLPDDDEEEEG